MKTGGSIATEQPSAINRVAVCAGLAAQKRAEFGQRRWNDVFCAERTLIRSYEDDHRSPIRTRG